MSSVSSGSRSSAEPAPATAAQSAESVRARYGVAVVLAGLTVIAFALWIALHYYKVGGVVKSAANSAGAVATVLAPVTTVIGTIVGAYFGVQAGAAGKAEAFAARDTAEDQAKKLAAVAPPGAAAQVLGMNPNFE